MPVLRVLAVPDLQLNDSEDAAQMHRLALAAVRLSSAEGGGTPPWRLSSSWSLCSKGRRVHSRPSSNTSISISRRLRIGLWSEFMILSRFRLFNSDEEPFITLPVWRQCQEAHGALKSLKSGLQSPPLRHIVGRVG